MRVLDKISYLTLCVLLDDNVKLEGLSNSKYIPNIKNYSLASWWTKYLLVELHIYLHAVSNTF